MALTIAAWARWITPFSGPSQRSCVSLASLRQKPAWSAMMLSSAVPTTKGSSARIAATTTSLPRPIVNAKPWPLCAPSVFTVTYAAE